MSRSRYPRALYAAAGLGDLAAEQVRKLPERAGQLQEWARTEIAEGSKTRTELSELGGRIGTGLATARTRASHLGETLAETDVRTDLRRVSDAALRKAAVLSVAAQRNLSTAQTRAVDIYGRLVSHGEEVLDGPEAVEPPVKATAEVGEPVAAQQDTAPKAAKPTRSARKATAGKTAGKASEKTGD